MTCHPFQVGSMTGFVCTRERVKRCDCGNKGVFLCDWKTPEPGSKSATCDAPLCGRCALSPEPEKHLCPVHAKTWAEWRRAKRAVERREPHP
jgi:hypothetical protein